MREAHYLSQEELKQAEAFLKGSSQRPAYGLTVLKVRWNAAAVATESEIGLLTADNASAALTGNRTMRAARRGGGCATGGAAGGCGELQKPCARALDGQSGGRTQRHRPAADAGRGKGRSSLHDDQ